MSFLLILISVAFSLGQLGRISFYNQQINVYVYELFLTIFLLFLFLKYQLRPIGKLWAESKSLHFFILALVISFVLGIPDYSVSENFVGLLYLFRLIAYLFYWIYFSYWLKRENKSAFLSKAFEIIIFLTIVTTGLQYLFYPDLRNLIYQGWDPHLYRTFGVFFDTGIAGSIFGIMMFFSKNLLVKGVFLLFLILSFSRSVYLSIFATISYLFFTGKEFKKILLYLILGLILILVVPKPSGEGVNLLRTYSIISRAQDNQLGWKLFENKPLLGYGYNRIRFVKNDLYSHSGSAFSSSFLTMLVAGGLIGFSGWIYFLKFLWQKYKRYRGILLFLSVVSLFDNIILHPFILFLLLTILSDS